MFEGLEGSDDEFSDVGLFVKLVSLVVEPSDAVTTGSFDSISYERRVRDRVCVCVRC